MQGTKITPGNSEDLMALAQTCITAVTFMECSRGILPALNELVTQGTIIDRLPPQLKHKWHEYKYEVLGMDGAVPFDRLASWIERQANIARSETTQVSSAVLPSQSVGTANIAAIPPTSTTSVAPSQNMSPATQTTYQLPSRRTNPQSQVLCMACRRTGTGHNTAGCPTFRKMPPMEQRGLRVCFKCLNPACHPFGSKCKGNAKLKEPCTCLFRPSDGQRVEHNEAMKCTNE